MAEPAHILPGLRLRSHRFQLPLDYARSDGETIEVFAREVWAPDREGQQLPWLVFFQGGPGFGAPRPMGPNGWIGRALRDFRVLLLDQRGCGLSSPVTAQTLAALGDAQRQAAWLRHFRADNIVRDAEAIRRQLIGDEPWSVLGQSFGGFCAMRYLSSAPEGLREVLITGGIPPLTRTTDDIYRATYPRVRAKNLRYYARYPEDRQRVRDIVAHLLDHEVTMPRGGRLTPERFLQLGIAFGASDGFEAVHYLLEEAFVDIGGARHLNANFLLGIEEAQSFDSHPIYALLHEACYTQGEASAWSAGRLRDSMPGFALPRTAAQALASDEPILFTGEMIYPWMFEQYPGLIALRGAAEALAAKTDWPALYDVQRLRRNRVPVAAAVYYDDMYVHREFSEETAAIVPNMRLWVTNEHEHNGLRADGEKIFERLLRRVRDEA
ncbi:MAG: alpha/beta hydrolase [Burkholderiales bacterium]|nr:alpha/beta hydrolase [Burkholderiales bacterium]